ncbi:TetR/AcrR family transcriptional regulator [Dehalobacterium formicoaceticum]|uniref:TetR/AcrR family transcriptional regulator n=1 Tax=Dehalobacterium formicoaceticum TaxID=51515 RepID=A0ABT1Y1E1_9FIRM|nr:TetR/AcrR family transcriptional regulator [Dehalobacterium formicoaceticum]MCR6544388.1 TetR/AcrR family transcriptional regulator [Dehalobacterium formicoaceticum]
MAYRETERTQEKMARKKRDIIKAAREIFAEKGYQGTSMKALAQKAKIATGTVYLYFSNKEVLMSSIVDEMFRELLTIIKNEREKYCDGFDKLQASMDACFRVFMKEKTMARIFLVQVPGVNSTFQKKLHQIENELVLWTQKDLEELKAEGRLPEKDTLVSALAFVGSFRQVLFHYLMEGEPQDLETAYIDLKKYNLRGLGHGHES